MDSQFNAYTYDPELLAEIEMTTSLMISASAAPGRLSVDAIDNALGLTPLARGPRLRQRADARHRS
jgi:hypothetical protein